MARRTFADQGSIGSGQATSQPRPWTPTGRRTSASRSGRRGLPRWDGAGPGLVGAVGVGVPEAWLALCLQLARAGKTARVSICLEESKAPAQSSGGDGQVCCGGYKIQGFSIKVMRRAATSGAWPAQQTTSIAQKLLAGPGAGMTSKHLTGSNEPSHGAQRPHLALGVGFAAALGVAGLARGRRDRHR